MKSFLPILLSLLLSVSALAQRHQVVASGDISQLLSDSLSPAIVHGQNQGFAFLREKGSLPRRSAILRSGGQCLIFDHHSGRITSAQMLPHNTSHCNNASSTTGGLLWVSECYGRHQCFVYTLQHDSLILSHLLSYQGDEHWFAHDWCVDEAAGRLYVYGGNKGESLWLKELDLKKALSADTVAYISSDVLHATEIRGVTLPQGSLVRNGRAYLLDGDQPGKTFLHVYDLSTGEHLLQMPIGDGSLEPEGLDIRGRWVYVSFGDARYSGVHIIRYRIPRRLH